MPSAYSSYTRLTPHERQFLSTHPIDALSIQENKDKAYLETTRLFGRNGHNDKTDAFRHCYWSALLARDIGYADALAFTTAHESSPTNPPNEKAMDLHNNRIGLLIGKPGMSDLAISAQCVAALNAGRLKIIKPAP